MGVRREKGNADKNLEILLKDVNGLEARVGWFEGNNYPQRISKEGKPTGKVVPVAYVAAIHEYGYPEGGIPPRPFMQPTVELRGKVWAGYIKRALNNNAEMRNAFEALSLGAVGDIQKRITEIRSPALKPETVAARQRRYLTKRATQDPAKPLIDSGQMLRTITYQIKES